MDRALSLTLIRLCLGLLALSAMLAGSWVQAAVPAAGDVVAVVICSHGEEKTVFLNAQGDPAPVQQECRDCPACNLPAAIDTPLPCTHARPVTLAAAVAPALAAGPVLRQAQLRPSSRAPPISDIRDGHFGPADRIDLP